MKQLWVRFDSGFQKLQSHLETHCSDHLGHSDPFRTPHVENTLKTTTMATLKTSGSKRKRQDWKGRTQWLSPLWVQSTCQQSLGVNWDFSKVWEPLRFQHWLEKPSGVCISSFPLTVCSVYLFYCPSFIYRAVLSLQKAFQTEKALIHHMQRENPKFHCSKVRFSQCRKNLLKSKQFKGVVSSTHLLCVASCPVQPIKVRGFIKLRSRKGKLYILRKERACK